MFRRYVALGFGVIFAAESSDFAGVACELVGVFVFSFSRRFACSAKAGCNEYALIMTPEPMATARPKKFLRLIFKV